MKIKKDLFRKTSTLKGNSQNRGITLIALVVTVIILLILAGISIAQLTGNGLFEKAKLAKEEQENAKIEEDEKLGDYENKIDKTIAENTRNNSQEETYKEIGTFDAGTKVDISKLNFNEIFLEVHNADASITFNYSVIKQQLTDETKVAYFGFSTILGVIDGYKAKLQMNSSEINLIKVWQTNNSNTSFDNTNSFEVTYYYR